MQIEEEQKAKALAALYNNSQPGGRGHLRAEVGIMSEESAAQLLEKGTYFDYLKGRPLKMNMSGTDLDFRLYDRDNGQGEGERVVRAALGTQ